MRASDEARQALHRLFKRQQTAELTDLFTALRTRSRMTVFRRLSAVGYLSSYSHTGRYYTLADVPVFDVDGLWEHEGVGFSRLGTLKETVARLVEQAKAGLLHRELQSRLRVRVHNTLADLVAVRRIGREHLRAEYLYVSAVAARAAAQVAQRHAQAEEADRAAAPTPLDLAHVIDVLVLVIQRPSATAAQLAAALRSRGLDLSDAQVEGVFTRYALGKKTARSRSRRSRR